MIDQAKLNEYVLLLTRKTNWAHTQADVLEEKPRIMQLNAQLGLGSQSANAAAS